MDLNGQLIMRMNTPRVVIENVVCPTATLIMVDSGTKNGFLLESVQILGDLNLSVNKAFISSNGHMFRNVFYVTDEEGSKLTDEVIDHIEQCIPQWSDRYQDKTALELTTTDRTGLLSEIFSVLAGLHCKVVEAKVWTHNGRVASLIYITDDRSSGDLPIAVDYERVELIKARLQDLLGDGAKTAVSVGAATHIERRLHQMMFADRDYEKPTLSRGAVVVVKEWWERGYTAVTIKCRDRPKLLFDVLCTLTDMDYVIFNATIDTNGSRAHQEFHIRHADGTPISLETEKQCLIQCLQAAINRRTSEGVRLELCTGDRQGLLADVTHSFQENGLSVTQADVSTLDRTAANVFYVTPHAAEHPVKAETIEAIRQSVGVKSLMVKESRPVYPAAASLARVAAKSACTLKKLFTRNLCNLGPVSSSS